MTASTPTSHNPSILTLGLDHVALATRDLAGAASAFDRLGFTLSPHSMHAGSVTPGGPVMPWGSGNHCLMFRRGYFELLGLVDPALPSNAKALVEQYEGLHIVALDCDDATRAHERLTVAGVLAKPPIQLERDACFGPDNAGVRRAGFRNIYPDPAAYPEARFIVIEHRTRDVLWQEHLMTHPNGVESLESVMLVVPDLPQALARLRHLLGTPTQVDDTHRFDMRHGAVWLMEAAALLSRCPVLRADEVHRVAAVAFGVPSLAGLRVCLDQQGIAYAEAPSWVDGEPTLWVAPDQAAHAAIQFVQKS